MSRWPLVKLGEVLRRVERFEPRNELKEYHFAGTYSFARGIFVGERKFGSAFALPKIQRIHSGDFIYCKIMAWEGAFGIAPKEVHNHVMSNAFVVYELDHDKLDAKFIDYFFKVPAHWKAIGSQSSGTNVRRQSLHPNQFEESTIPLPPLSEQRRIVARIEEVTVKVNEIRTIRAEEECQIQRILANIFSDIIQGAPREKMSKVAPMTRRTVDIALDASYPELGIRSFGKGTFHKPAVPGLDLGTKRIFRIKANDLLFSNVFAWEGAIAVAQEKDDGRFGSHRFISCVPRHNIAVASFLCFYFLSDEGIELIRAVSPGSAGRNRTLGIEALQKIKVPVPHIEKQKWFARLQSELSALKCLQAEIAIDLDALIPAVLDRAFKGEL